MIFTYTIIFNKQILSILKPPFNKELFLEEPEDLFSKYKNSSIFPNTMSGKHS